MRANEPINYAIKKIFERRQTAKDIPAFSGSLDVSQPYEPPRLYLFTTSISN
jgi:hypothetical protein